MRFHHFITLPFLVFGGLMLTTQIALSADDGFGGASAFSNTRETAFEDPSDLPSPEEMQTQAMIAAAKRAANIQPAAGEHDNPPEEDKIEVELEEKFDTEITRTQLDRAAGSTSSRDRIGEDKVGVFYDHNNDERIMDDDDTIGVEVRLLEFE